jgi:hypothetical protein
MTFLRDANCDGGNPMTSLTSGCDDAGLTSSCSDNRAGRRLGAFSIAVLQQTRRSDDDRAVDVGLKGRRPRPPRPSEKAPAILG